MKANRHAQHAWFLPGWPVILNGRVWIHQHRC